VIPFLTLTPLVMSSIPAVVGDAKLKIKADSCQTDALSACDRRGCLPAAVPA
jgi:hypothetical protein